MTTRTLKGLVLASTLALSGTLFAQTAKQDMKDSGHETKAAAEDAGHGIAKGTKKGYRKTKHGLKHLGHKIEGKKDTPANNPPA